MTETYDIYHDESTEDAFWHGFLFIPSSEREYFLELLKESREHYDYNHKIHYTKIHSGHKIRNGVPAIIRSWTQIGIAAIQQQKFVRLPTHFSLGITKSNRTPIYKKLKRPIKSKFSVVRVRDNHSEMNLIDDPLRKIEYTFKMALKGTLHKLCKHGEVIQLGDIFIDGDEHYQRYGRNFDGPWVINRLRNELRPHIKITESSRIIAQNSNHHKLSADEDQDNSHFLQLCDVLLGGVRFHSFCPDKRHVKYEVSRYCRYLLEHDQQNLARMKESRYFGGFHLGETWIDKNGWQFADLKPKKDDAEMKYPQSSLFELNG